MELHGTFPWNSMENVDAGISMEIGVLMFSMEFHGKCPNPPCKYFPWKSMKKFSWNSMEINVLILHGIPWRIFNGNPWNSEVFHTGFKAKPVYSCIILQEFCFFALRLDSSQDHKRTSQNICIFVAAAVMLQVRFDFRLNLI